MKYLLSFILLLFLFGCAQKERTLTGYPETKLLKSDLSVDDNYKELLTLFINNCKTKKAQKLYGKLCQKAQRVEDPELFFKNNFTLYQISSHDGETEGLLTGYYEASLQGSLQKTEVYKYPVYTQPRDLIIVDLDSIYPELKKYRLRGRVVGNKVVPYYKRGERNDLNAEVICYVKDKVKLFFLEVQGSGRIELENGDVLYVGYANQNGHRYRSIGKYMIDKGYISKENVSMQTIEKFLQKHPKKVDEVLNYNSSMVFFQKRTQPATGALGVVLEPMRSIAVDRSKLPLGGMYFYKALDREGLEGVVFAQDVGGAIKGSVRADLFTGHTQEARELAGTLRSPLNLWIFLPKEKDDE